jgi:hypothetical protein
MLEWPRHDSTDPEVAVGKVACSFVVSLAASLVALVVAVPALADGEPPTPLSASTTNLVITGIVVAAVVVAAGLILAHVAAAHRRSKEPRRTPDESAP